MHTLFVVACAALGLLMLGSGGSFIWIQARNRRSGILSGPYRDSYSAQHLCAIGTTIGGALMLVGLLSNAWVSVVGGVVAAVSYVAFAGISADLHQAVVRGARANEARTGREPAKFSAPSSGLLLASLTVIATVGLALT